MYMFSLPGFFSADLGDPHLDMNLVCNCLRYGKELWQSQEHVAASVDAALRGPWRWAAELRGVHTSDLNPLYCLGAVTYQPHRAISWDFGVEFGLNNDSPRYTLSAGVVFILLK